MSESESNRGVLAPAWRDLWFVGALCALTVAVVFAPVVRETPIRVVVGLGFVLFAPGYAFVAALFPEQGDESTDPRNDNKDDRGGTLDNLERLVLSFGASIALVPLVGLALNFTPWGIQLVPVVVALVALTLGLAGLAAVRRRSLHPTDRYRVPRVSLNAIRRELLQPTDRTDAALNVLLVVSVLVALSSVAFAVAVPTQGEAFTEFYLLTENESGDLVADDYPTNFTAGEPKPIVVGIGNHEHKPMNYTVVVELQRVNVSDGDIRVVEEKRLDRFQMRLSSGETWQERRTIRPEMTGDRLRLQYLLYRGTPPAEPNAENAYRHVHLWISVNETSS